MDGQLVALAGIVAAVVSMLLTPLVLWVSTRFEILDRPGGYKAHGQATPLLGGISVALGCGAGIGFAVLQQTPIFPGITALTVGGLVILAAGIVDDVRGLSPRHKFAWQVLATATAGTCLAVLGVRLDLFLHIPSLPIICLTVLWVVGITNSMNFLDNMNGLCAGIGAIAAIFLALINLRSGEPSVALGSAALAGACLGFLPFNYPRGRIFLGDTGSMWIGFLLAALSVMGVYTRGAPVPIVAVFTPLFLLGIPVLDLVLVVLLRVREGHPPWEGDRRHISHRLVRRGMTPAAAVAALWAGSAACGLAALLLPTVGAEQAPLLFGLLLFALGALAMTAGTKGLS